MAGKGGGKPGRRMPSELLKDYRWVHENAEAPEGDVGWTPMRRKIREQYEGDFDKFIARYERLEGAHRAGKSQGGVPEEASGVPPVQVVDLDRGRARLQEILGEKGWEKCDHCGKSMFETKEGA